MLLLASLPFIIRFRGKYKGILNSLTSGDITIKSGYYPLLLIIPTVLIAIMNLL